MIASQITSLTIVYSTVIQTQIKENIKAPRHWPLCGKSPATGEFPAQRASNTENVPICTFIINLVEECKEKDCNDHKNKSVDIRDFIPERIFMKRVLFGSNGLHFLFR